jgi:arylsulfatase A-like enzyme
LDSRLVRRGGRRSGLGALNPTATHGIADGETTLAELLRARGYATAIYGKWHLGHLPPFLPTRHGFDDYLGLPYSNDMWPRHPQIAHFPVLPLYSRDAVLTRSPDQSQLTGEYTRRALAFIEANRARPFFLYLPTRCRTCRSSRPSASAAARGRGSAAT